MSTPDQAAQVTVPDAVEAHALRIAVLKDRSVRAAAALAAARMAALPDFAAIRNRGRKTLAPRLPDGTELGTISIEKGSLDIQVDDELLILCVAPPDLEEYVVPAAWADERVIKLVADFFPELVERRIRPGVRAELQAELTERHGVVANRVTGELEKVADVTPRPASGAFSWLPGKLAVQQISAAIEAGIITEDGRLVTPAVPAEEAPGIAALPPVERAPALPAARKGPSPTGEQQAVIDVFADGKSLVVEAGAGTGKTSTLVMSAAAVPSRRGMYIAFNKAIADDAKAKFPPSVRCSTAHALAMAAVGHQYRHRMNGQRIPAREQAGILGITSPAGFGEKTLAPARLARLAIETVERFCRSDSPDITLRHVPHKPGLSDTRPAHEALGDAIVPLARKAWADLSGRDGRLRFDHGHYLKLWQLSQPILSTDFILFDEAQDASPVVLDVIVRQEHAQLVAVGDRSQAINGWNGAVDAMDKFPASARLSLSQSFRFGPAVAREANKWLSVLGADLQLKGFDRISSMVRPLDNPDAILCRTNAETMVQAMRGIEAGQQVAIVGGGSEIKALAEAARDLKAGKGTAHPELFAFTSWAEVQDHAENDATGSDLRVLVNLIDEHGPEKIIAMTGRLADEKSASVVVSTAHKAKGREWDSVRIACDFREPRRDPDKPEEVPQVPDDLAMLAYVAVTRAQLTLDRAGLAWVDNYLPGAVAA